LAPDIVFAHQPLQFVVAFLVFAGGGALHGLLVLNGAWRAKFGK
jgi:hypothetical protein